MQEYIEKQIQDAEETSRRAKDTLAEYEVKLGGVIADAITGGDIPGGTLISEQYLLDLEREGFIKLCRNEKTLERIEHMLKTGKPLRN